MNSARQTLAGVAAGVGAGAVWGLVFLVPELAKAFSPLQLAIGRYFFYGLISAALLVPRWAVLGKQLAARQWLDLTWLSLAGNTLYFVFLSYAIQTGGIAMTSLVIGLLPVAVTIVGSREAGAVPLGVLLPSLALCAAAAACIGWQALMGRGAISPADRFLGLLCAISALASWTSFAVGNARCLMQLEEISAHEWSLLTGIVTGAQSIILMPLAALLKTPGHSLAEWVRFAAITGGIALLASIGGNALWNRMSRLLPLTLVGQMILFETIFALAFGLLWEHRAPTALEVAALTFVVLSVLTCLSAHSRPPEWHSASAPARQPRQSMPVSTPALWSMKWTLGSSVRHQDRFRQ